MKKFDFDYLIEQQNPEEKQALRKKLLSRMPELEQQELSSAKRASKKGAPSGSTKDKCD